MPLIGRDKVDKAIKNIPTLMNDKVKAVWTKGLSTIITTWPVHFKDGGTSRNSWFLYVDNLGSDLPRSADGRAASGSHASLDKMPKWVLGKKIYFANPTKWSPLIEYGGYPKSPAQGTWTGSSYQKLSVNGYSAQLPSGVVRSEITKMRAKL